MDAPRAALGSTPVSVRTRARPLRVSTLARAAALYGVLVVSLVLTALPFLWMIAGSFKTNDDFFSHPGALIPSAPTTQNYVDLLNGSSIPFLHQFANSLIVAVATTLISLAVCSLTGYGFAKFEFRFKRLLFVLVLATLMVPAQVTLVPLFLLMHTLGWLDTLQGVTAPGIFTALGVFLMRQTMLSVPNELLDAARIDGASELRLFWRVALPLARAGLSVLAILVFLQAWNDFLWPVIVLQTDTNMTVAVGLSNLVGLYKVNYGMIDAGAFLVTLPIIVAFLALRNQFLSGLTAGALKGA